MNAQLTKAKDEIRLPSLSPEAETAVSVGIALFPILLALLVLVAFFHGAKRFETVVWDMLSHGELIVSAVALVAGPALLLLRQDLVAPPKYVIGLLVNLGTCVAFYCIEKTDEVGTQSHQINAAVFTLASILLLVWSTYLIYMSIIYVSQPTKAIEEITEEAELTLAEKLRRRRKGR